MPTTTDESPPRQQDDAGKTHEAGRPPRDEVRSFSTHPADKGGDSDADLDRIDDPDINTHGSER